MNASAEERNQSAALIASDDFCPAESSAAAHFHSIRNVRSLNDETSFELSPGIVCR
jgi:hypothetical protein